MKLNRLFLLLLISLLLTGCGGSESSTGNGAQPTTTDGQASSSTTVHRVETTGSEPQTTKGTTASTSRDSRTKSARSPRSGPQYGYTYGQESGNRIVEGTGRLPESQPVDVQLRGVPVWVAGVALEEDTAWVVALDDGRVQAFRMDARGEVAPTEISPGRLAPGQPPLVKSDGGKLELVTSQADETSELTQPVPISTGSENGLIYATQDGQITTEVDGRTPDIDRYTGLEALPDARFVRGAGGTLAFLSEPTERYDHGVLGDAIEANSITLLRPGDEESLEAGIIAPESGGVFEQVAPLWFQAKDLDGNLLAITESTPSLATRVSVYGLDGDLVAAGPFIGEPSKWRHLIAAGPFGPNGEIELVDTLTPHIGGTIEFYRPDFDNRSLDIVATQTGYTSHRIYTRNMDTARAGDLDGDGRWELLVPNDAYTELGAIRHEKDGATVPWTLPVDGTIVNNLASATNSDGRAQIAAGRQDGVLRIWP
ncbi:hypothetical protein BH23ACT11_BH23ACT11_19550 [soil metagenome]